MPTTEAVTAIRIGACSFRGLRPRADRNVRPTEGGEKHEDAEGGGVHDSVGGEIEEDAGEGCFAVAGAFAGLGGESGDADEHVATVGDGAVGEGALDVGLEK